MKLKIFTLISFCCICFINTKTNAEPEIGVNNSSIKWQEKENTDIYKKSGKPTIIDFYADWCVVCKQLEKETYTDKNVIEELNNFNTVKIDATNLTSEIKKSLYQYGLQGLPAIVFLDKQGKLIDKLTITGFKSPKEFIAVLKEVQKTN